MFKVFFLILFISFISLGCFAGQYPQGQGNLTVKEEVSDPYTWDFGRVKEGEVLKHEFILKNEYLKTLNIEDINTSCGCMVSEVKKRSLMPQESTTVEVQFSTKGYSGSTQQYIYVHTDNLDNPIMRYIIKADIVK